MTRRWNRHDEQDDGQRELDLAPFMNMAMILIPMLLLSVVFLKIGVVNVSAPELAPKSSASDEPGEGLNLTVAVGERGFEVATREGVLPSAEDCPDDGPTVCLADTEIDVQTKVEQARRAFREGREARGELLLQEVADAYDYAALYNRLVDLKDDHPDASELKLSASPDLPYTLLVRVMDAVRYRLDEAEIASNADFWEANTAAEGDSQRAKLFNDPVMAVGR